MPQALDAPTSAGPDAATATAAGPSSCRSQNLPGRRETNWRKTTLSWFFPTNRSAGHANALVADPALMTAVGKSPNLRPNYRRALFQFSDLW